MGFLDRFRATESEQEDLREENRQLTDSLELFTERMAELELALEDVNWMRLTLETHSEFSREGLDRITALSRLLYLKNPLINRSVEVQRLYVFGQGVSIRAKDEKVNELIKEFLKANKSEMQQKELGQKEVELQVTGNLFTALFTNASTGAVRMRSVPIEEIREIVCNPEDRNEAWFYYRSWIDAHHRVHDRLYPDYEYQPTNRPPKYNVGGRSIEIDWSVCMHHVKVGGFRSMRFGIPETYSALDWARAYKDFLEDWATIVRSYARFAWKRTVKGGKSAVAEAKRKLGSTVTTSKPYETNPLGAAATAILAEGHDLEPIRTSGATTKAEDGRRMLLMVAASAGLPETFFGDASVGTVATATSLDRPTQLKMADRQQLWGDSFDDLLQFAIEKSMAAPNGLLPQMLDEDLRHVDVDWPPILEQGLDTVINAIVAAATLNGSALAGTMDLETVSRLVLTALGQDDIDDLLEKLFPEGWDKEEKGTEAQEAFTEAVKTLREAVANLARD